MHTEWWLSVSMATLTEDNGGPARLSEPPLPLSDIPVGGVALLPHPSIHHIAPQMSYSEPRTVRTGKLFFLFQILYCLTQKATNVYSAIVDTEKWISKAVAAMFKKNLCFQQMHKNYLTKAFR